MEKNGQGFKDGQASAEGGPCAGEASVGAEGQGGPCLGANAGQCGSRAPSLFANFNPTAAVRLRKGVAIVLGSGEVARNDMGH